MGVHKIVRKIRFNPPHTPENAPNEEGLRNISRKSSKLTLSRGGGRNFMGKLSCGHLGVSDYTPLKMPDSTQDQKTRTVSTAESTHRAFS